MNETLTNQAFLPNLDALRAEFPALQKEARGRLPIYFDNAATVLKPRAVIAAITEFLECNGSNVHRGVHYLSVEGSEQYEDARDTIARFIGADKDEVVFLRNATEGINLVATALPQGARVLVTGLEHHSNLLPWRMRHDVTVVPLLPDGSIDESELFRLIGSGGFEFVACCHVSNVFGIVQPIDRIAEAARAAGSKILIDGAQGAPHLPVDVHALDVDFYAFSGHKLGGPTGLGVLFAKRERLAAMQPVLFGGNMVSAVHVEGQTIQDGPLRFEAGTPAIEAALGLAAACDFLEDIGLAEIRAHEEALAQRFTAALKVIPGVVLHGPTDPGRRIGVVTFSVEGAPANMVAKVLSDRINACVRSGWLCAQPMHEELSLEPTVRASFFLYNTPDEVDAVTAVVSDLASTC